MVRKRDINSEIFDLEVFEQKVRSRDFRAKNLLIIRFFSDRVGVNFDLNNLIERFSAILESNLDDLSRKSRKTMLIKIRFEIRKCLDIQYFYRHLVKVVSDLGLTLEGANHIL